MTADELSWLAMGLAVFGLTLNLIAAGFLIASQRRLRRLQAAPSLRPCSCGHGFGTHDDGGRCNGVADKESRFMPCSCLRHDGEIPADLWGRLP